MYKQWSKKKTFGAKDLGNHCSPRARAVAAEFEFWCSLTMVSDQVYGGANTWEQARSL